MAKTKLVREFWGYLKTNKALWLIPILIILLLIGIVIFLSQSQAMAPFLYS